MKKYIITSLLLANAFVCAQAGETAISTHSEPVASSNGGSDKPICEKIFDATTLYSNDSNPYIQKFSIVGRQQFEYYYFKRTDDQKPLKKESANDWINRRSRVGFKAQLFQNFTAHVETDLNFQTARGHTYNKLTDAYLQYKTGDYKFTLGKHGIKYTLDGSTSSTALGTIDRSNIANNFWYTEEYLPGFTAEGKTNNFIYRGQFFSLGEADREFGGFNGGHASVFSIGYDLSETLNADSAVIMLDNMFSSEDNENRRGTPRAFAGSLDQVSSLNFVYEKGAYGLGVDLVNGQGARTQSDLMGFQFAPSMYIGNGWQGVFRFTYIESDQKNGVRFSRYENQLDTGRGDEYTEFYLGLNKYFCSHNLKWQTGLQYTMMDDSKDTIASNKGAYEGWGVTTGIRIKW